MSLVTLPNELLLMIAGNLRPTCLLSLMLCCKQFHTFGNDTLKKHAVNSPYFKTAALFWAAITGDENLIRLLLTVGAPIKVVENTNNRPGEQVVRHLVPSPCTADTVLYVIEKGTALLLDTFNGPLPAVSWAVQNHHITLLRLAISHHANIEWRGHLQDTALHISLRIGNESMASLLMSSGADINATDINGCQALDIAVRRCGNPIETILKLGADPNRRNFRGVTALHYAARAGNERAVKTLLKYHADPNAADGDQITPLHRAAGCKDSARTVQILLDYGADVTVMNALRRNSFQLAEDSGNPAVGILLEQLYLASPRGYHPGDRSYLHLAILHSQPRLVKNMLAAHVNVNARDRAGQTPLHYAAKMGKCDMVGMLVNAGGSVDAIDNFGKSPLHIAARIQGLVLFWELLMRGERTSFSLRDGVEGCTPLHLAARTIVDPSGAYSRCDGAERDRLWSAIAAKERSLFAEVMERRKLLV